MKKKLSTLLFVLPLIAFSQSGNVGINTTTPNTTLTVNGGLQTGYSEKTTNYTLTKSDYYVTYNGTTDATFTLPSIGTGTTSFAGRMYRIKNVSNKTLTLVGNGTDKLRNTDNVGVAAFNIPTGYYVEIVNNAKASGGTWDLSYTGAPQAVAIPNNWQLDNVFKFVAANSVTYNIGGGVNYFIKDDIDLGDQIAVTIPAGKKAFIFTTYNIPVGIGDGTFDRNNVFGYYGIRFVRSTDGTTFTEEPQGSRKSTFLSRPNASPATTTTISAFYTEEYDNTASTTPITITYRLYGYLETENRFDANTIPVIWNMWKPTAVSTDPNKNWGYGIINSTVYTKN